LEPDVLIDAFVRKINRSPRRRIREEDVPHRLRKGGAEFGLYYNWTIQRFDHINWIEPLEAHLPARLPPSYRSLVTRYIFPAFEVPPLVLLANTGQTLYHEMSMEMAHDKALSDVLLKSGFAQFARLYSGDSDPVCFDFRQQSAQGECPIVRISYPLLLSIARAQIVEEIAPSFYEFIDRFLRETPTARRPRPRSREQNPR
jgi:hypothetical protein